MKTLQTIILSFIFIMISAGFAFAVQTIAPGTEFPFFHLGCLVMGGLVITSIKHRYEKLYMSEAIGSFALYAILVTIFTSPFVEALKVFIS